ncbi:hypothetical protein RB614_09730 [Phytohabitans sp. ZYX-F-186]|uniref:Uncharacterized protein n=1 Tax=Phytohabitans maris TaxID=3071409 RepID=A0ABU0ZCK3_9ACTN|nr:hypothetical protein [Phytohabitans sp. ZYX-F-186]MDQ7904799.1 hypothetical protein [Phytohabitans sp. ZYX-F-186]
MGPARRRAATAATLAGEGARVYAVDLAQSIDKAARIPGVEYVEADVTTPDGE